MPTVPMPSEKLVTKLSRRLVGEEDVRQGSMFGCPAWFVGRRLFVCVYGEVVGLKLPAPVVSELEHAPGFIPFQPMGKPRMREWIAIEDAALLERGAIGERLLRDAVAFARKGARP